MEIHDPKRLRLLYSLGDFQLALSAAQFLLEIKEDGSYETLELRRFRCYETSMIISNYRPFSWSNGGIPKFDFDMIEMVLDKEQKELHDEIRKLRNKVFAHSDKEMMAMEAKTFPVREEDNFPQFLHVRFDEGVRFVGLRLLEVIALINEIVIKITKLLYQKVQETPDEFNLSVRPPTL